MAQQIVQQMALLDTQQSIAIKRRGCVIFHNSYTKE
jgi:hypothetical protein